MSAPARPRPATRLTGLLVRSLAVLCCVVAPCRAGDEPAPAAKAKDAEEHLDFKKTYAAALLEARIRNVPVFVSRHKDFWGRCTRQYRSVLTNKKFIGFARENLVVLIAHNELGHDPVDGTDYDGKPARMCPLYPGVTCREHVDAAVDLETERDEDLTTVPFIELCPNSWLVPPQGEPIRIAEDDQFVVGKIEAQVEKLQKALGPAVPKKAHDQVVNALGQADVALEAEDWSKALSALAGVATHVKKPHRGLQGLVDARVAQVEEHVGWLFEDLAEGDEPLAERRKAVAALVKALDVEVYGKKPGLLATMQTWLKDNAP